MPLTGSSGLIYAPSLMQHKVTVDMKFQPSVGILARRVDKLGADIRSFREPLQRIVKEVMIPSIRRNFDVGGRPTWEPLAEATIRKKGNANILIDSGALRRTMGYQNIWTIDSEKAMITELPANVWYGGVHQAGHGGTTTTGIRNPLTGRITEVEEFGDGSIPARPFVVIQEEDVDDMERIMSEWVGERVRAAGLG